MLRVKNVSHKEPDPRSVLPGLGLSNTLYGIEIEVENVQSRKDLTWWMWTEDGSLRNNGAELILKQPTGGSDLEKALEEFTRVLEDLTSTQPTPPEMTERCSIHAHIDFRDATIEQVLSFFLGFCLFESALYTLGGKDRYDNIYCPGLSSCQPQIKEFNKIYTAMRNNNARSVESLLNSWSKYTVVNLLSVVTHGSVEVRSHKATPQAEDIILWLKVLDRLKQYTDHCPPEELVQRAVIQDIDFARSVFGELSSHILTDNYTTFRETNIRNAQDCLYWNSIMSLHKPKASDAQAIAEAIFNFLEN